MKDEIADAVVRLMGTPPDVGFIERFETHADPREVFLQEDLTAMADVLGAYVGWGRSGLSGGHSRSSEQYEFSGQCGIKAGSLPDGPGRIEPVIVDPACQVASVELSGVCPGEHLSIYERCNFSPQEIVNLQRDSAARSDFKCNRSPGIERIWIILPEGEAPGQICSRTLDLRHHQARIGHENDGPVSADGYSLVRVRAGNRIEILSCTAWKHRPITSTISRSCNGASAPHGESGIRILEGDSIKIVQRTTCLGRPACPAVWGMQNCSDRPDRGSVIRIAEGDSIEIIQDTARLTRPCGAAVGRWEYCSPAADGRSVEPIGESDTEKRIGLAAILFDPGRPAVGCMTDEPVVPDRCPGGG